MSGTVYEQTETTLGEGKWLKLVRTDYVDKHGKSCSWECFRRLKTSTTVQCVDIFAVLLSEHSVPKLILVKQYRAPINAYTYEFPAGLIGPTEEAHESAIRELWEETGYTATFPKQSPSSTSAPTSSGSSVSSKSITSLTETNCLSVPIAGNPATAHTRIYLVTLYVNGDLPCNQDVHPHNPAQEGEETEVVLVPLDEHVIESLDALHVAGNTFVEGRVYSYAAGFIAAQQMAKLSTAPS